MDPSGRVRDPQAGKDFRVGRFRLQGVAYLVKDARMGIDTCRRHPGMGGKKGADRAPGAGVVGLPQPAFDVGEQMIGQNGDEQMGAYSRP